ncbi:MAG: hypothetical protein ACPG61_17160 [Paracoccaceae bacterium]
MLPTPTDATALRDMTIATHNPRAPYATRYPVDLSEWAIGPDPEMPKRHIRLVERLDTNAPASASPLCCYIRSVLFYPADDPREYRTEWSVETKLILEDVVAHDGREYDVLSGRVSHDGTGWIMTYRARLAEIEGEA